MTMRLELAVAACALSLVAAAGCAPIAVGPAATAAGHPPQADSPPRSSAGASAAHVPSGQAPAESPPVATVVDSTPSAAALGVLSRIPEPLTPAPPSSGGADVAYPTMGLP